MGVIVAGLIAFALQDASGRVPEPPADAQKTTLKQIKDLFKDDYAKRAPADQAALAAKLLQKGIETADDATSKFVLLKEAADLAAAAGDSETALKASRELGAAFAVDAWALRVALLTKLSAAIKDPEAARTAARSIPALVSEAVKEDAYEAATSILAKGEGLARSAQDAALAGRLAELKKDLASLKDEYGKVKPALEKPGTGDADALGRYLCFVKGDWDSGMVHLVAGAKGPLKALVEKDLANPVEAGQRSELAQAWADFAAKEKSPWRRARIKMRTRHWLEKALADATGVTKLKIEKQLGELEDSDPGTVNLLRLIDLKADTLFGTWSLDGGVLVSGTEEWAKMQLPYAPPEEYDLTVVLERREGVDQLGFSLAQGKTNFALYVDSWPSRGGMTGIDSIDGAAKEKDPNMVKGMQLTNGKAVTMVISVRKSGVKYSIDGKPIFSWTGNMNRLGPGADWKPKDPKAPLLVGVYKSRYVFTKFVLTTITGQGKPLR